MAFNFFQNIPRKNAYIYPETVLQDSKFSITNGEKYDFTSFSSHEVDVIRAVLNNAWSGKYPVYAKGIGLANEASPIMYKPRYVLHWIIVKKYENSENPFDALAVAAAFRTIGASARRDAIHFYEKWNETGSGSQKREAIRYFFDAREPFYSYNLADLYQRENCLEDALRYAIAAEKMNRDHAPGFPLLIATIYKKMDIQLSVEYLEKICQSNAYRYMPVFRAELEKATELLEKGYKYKPRPRKNCKSDVEVESQIAAAAHYFLREKGG